MLLLTSDDGPLTTDHTRGAHNLIVTQAVLLHFINRLYVSSGNFCKIVFTKWKVFISTDGSLNLISLFCNVQR